MRADSSIDPSPSHRSESVQAEFALEARGLTKEYGAYTALDRLELRVPPGEVACLLGPNGAGKTTTINLFTGFTNPSAGAAFVDGLEVARDPLEARRRLAYIPEMVSLYGNLSG